MPSLLDLPTEILTEILLKLDLQDLTTCREVCRRVRVVIDTSSEIQYRINLFSSGAIDGIPGGLAIADRLDRLKAHRRAWQDSKLLLDPTCSPPDVVVNSQDTPQIPIVNVPFNGPLVATLVGPELRLSHPRSPTRCMTANEWRVNVARINLIPDYGASDLARNVVVICGRDSVDFRFYCHIFLLRQDGQMVPHPLALHSVIWLRVIVDLLTIFVTQLSVCGDFFACLLVNSIYIFNWKTGSLLLDLRHHDRMQLQLLEDGLLLVGRQDELYVYAVEPHPLEPAVQHADPRPICTLNLPSSPGRVHASFIQTIECQVPWETHEYRGAFQDDPAAALVVLTFDFISEPRNVVRHILCIPRSVLLARITATVHDGAPPAELRWENWATEGSMLLRVHGELSADAKRNMSVSAAGSRVAVAFARLFPTGRGVDPEGILVDTFVFHAHRWAGFVPREEEEHDRAEKYFNFAPAPAAEAQDARRMPAGPWNPLLYNIYSKLLRIGTKEFAGMSVPMAWSVKLFEDGLAVMREEPLRSQWGRKLRLTHSYMFSA